MMIFAFLFELLLLHLWASRSPMMMMMMMMLLLSVPVDDRALVSLVTVDEPHNLQSRSRRFPQSGFSSFYQSSPLSFVLHRARRFPAPL